MAWVFRLIACFPAALSVYFFLCADLGIQLSTVIYEPFLILSFVFAGLILGIAFAAITVFVVRFAADEAAGIEPWRQFPSKGH